MSSPSFESFSDRLGEAFAVTPHDTAAVPGATSGGKVELRLDKVARLGSGQREGGSFSLIFSGPAAAPLPQATHEMRIGETLHPIFLVPVAHKEDRLEYEAIFN